MKLLTCQLSPTQSLARSTFTPSLPARASVRFPAPVFRPLFFAPLSSLTFTLLTLLFLVVIAPPSVRAIDTSIFTNTAVRTSILRRPSIILLQFHGLGFGDLSCYGQTNFQTPNLDQLATDGFCFNHYSPGTTNLAWDEAALLSGTTNAPEDSTLPLATLLKVNGYRTGFIGEWMLPGVPWDHGFEDFAGFLNPDNGTNYYPDFFDRYTPKMYRNPLNHTWESWQPGDGPNNGGPEMIYQNTGGQKIRYLPDFMLAGWVENFVKSHKPDRFNGFRPFFLMVNLPAPRSATPGTDDFPVPSDAPYTDSPWPQSAKNRAALLIHLDGDIGRLLEQLQQLKMTNDLAIFVTSSAPPEKFANPQLNFFRSPADFQSQTNQSWTAPMIVYWPGTVKPGQTSDTPWTSLDFLPTVLQMSSSPLSLSTSGKSILPLLLGQDEASVPK